MIRPARSLALAALLGAAAVAVAACGGPGPSPLPGSSAAPPSAAPGSSATGSPTPAASVDGEALATAFVAILGDPALHANVVQQATAAADQAGDLFDFRATMSGVLALPDVDLELAIEAEGQATRFRVVVAGDQTYLDLGEGWVAAPPDSVQAADLADSFAVVKSADDLEYVGSQEVDGRTLYHLASTRPLPYTPAGIEGTGTGTMNDLDAYVEADGTPVRIELSFTSTSTASTGTTTVNGTTEIRFSDVGGDQVVVAPTPAPSSAPSEAPSPAAVSG